MLDAANTRIISLLTTNVKAQKFIRVSRETMEEALKSLNIVPKVKARRSNAMWDILQATEQEAKQLARSILKSKAVRLQTEYMGTRKSKITIHRVPIDISKDRMGAFFSKYGQVDDVSTVISKSSIVIGDFVLQVTLGILLKL